MEVTLKYVPWSGPAMELRLTLPEKSQEKPLANLLAVVSKAYAKRHGAVEADCAVYREGARLDLARPVGDALAAGDTVIIRPPRPAPAAAAPVVAARARPRRRLVRVNVVSDPN